MDSQRWRYERGEHRYKHRWKHDHAGFQPDGPGGCGKCPKHIEQELAERLLNARGIPFYEHDDSLYPDKIYVLYGGVPYVCVPTRAGISCHGYPWRGDMPARALPKRIERKMQEQAEADGNAKEFKAWLKDYGG